MYCWMLSICCSEWRIDVDRLVYMDGTYLSFIDISYDVLLKHFLDILAHVFGIWWDYILGHVVGDLMS